ncbi:hypothetical protein AKJ16_DCAP24417, partial [Drosera capensis]
MQIQGLMLNRSPPPPSATASCIRALQSLEPSCSFHPLSVSSPSSFCHIKNWRPLGAHVRGLTCGFSPSVGARRSSSRRQ